MIGLRECREHGAFRGEECPECGNQGKLLMDQREIDSLGKILAGMLRHFPERYGIRLDDHGWAKVFSIVPAIKAEKRHFGWLTPHHIEAFAQTEPKGRYQWDRNSSIRATYGHTIPVNMDDLPTDDIPDKLFYQTTPDEIEFIKETGIGPSDKTWVHLSKTYRQAYVSGLFHVDNPLVVEIDVNRMLESGRKVYRATPEIFLVKEVPPEFFSVAGTEEVEPTETEKEEIERVKEKRARRREEGTF